MQNRFIVPSALFVITAFLFLSYLYGNPPVFPLDDAYIHFVYARNLANGYGLCFNAGETSFGTSSPIWVLLLACLSKMHIDLYLASLILSFLSYLFSAILIYFITMAILEERAPSLYCFMAALFYVSCGNMTWLSLSGMETAMFQMLCLAFILLYIKKGYGVFTALIAGALILCRITGLFLLIPVLVSDYIKEKKIRPSIILTCLTVLPYYLYQKAQTGLIFPVTASGKTLTYVESSFNFVRIMTYLTAVFKYLIFYEPAFFAAILIVITGFIVRALKKEETGRRNTLYIVITAWALLHLAMHALMFRTLNQNFRYLAVFFPALAILTAFFIRSLIRKRLIASMALFLLAAFSFFNQRYWNELYRNNLNHINNVYVECSNWIKQNTSDNCIAAFDIGIIKFLTDRYMVDLGGVTDPSIHPYLLTHDAGRFIHKKGASLIVYSRFPDCDLWPGVYRSGYDREGILKEDDLISFRTDYYEVPSITHSFQLDVKRVSGWELPTFSNIEKMFYADIKKDSAFEKRQIGINFELFGVRPGQERINVTRNMSQYVTLTYYWRATGKIDKKPLIKTMFINNKSGEVIIDKTHIPTHDLLPPEMWVPGYVVREKHVIWIPDNAPPGVYEIWISDGNMDQKILHEKSEALMKEILYNIAGKPFSTFPLCEGYVCGIKAAELIIEKSFLEILY